MTTNLRAADSGPIRKHASRALLTTAAACAAWSILVRPVENKAAAQQALLSISQREIEQFEHDADAGADLAPEIARMRRQLDDVYDWAALSGDPGRLYDALRRLAASSGVRIERIEPSTVRHGARQGARQPGDVQVETAGYTVEITGRYDAIADFVRACESDLGASRLSSFRIAATAPTPDGQAPVLSAVIETVHVSLSPPSRKDSPSTEQRRTR